MYEGFNPASRIKLNREEPRVRYLRPDEIGKFLAALDQLGKKSRYKNQVDAIKMLLFTGQRKNNVLGAEWKELDIDHAEWTIPGSKTKQGREMRVALAPAVIEILNKRTKAGRYVFPANSKRSKCGHIADIRKTLASACEIAGVKDLHLHDLRRTFGSWQANAGASLQVVGDSLGHADTATTERVYAHLGIETIRESVEKAVELMTKKT
jgi:integrase